MAQALLTKIGFDPDHINKKCRVKGRYGYWTVTPIFQFCQEGNLTMCRYLLSRGADCRKVDTKGNFPMVAAAAGGHSAIVQWLYHDGGAHDDIQKVTVAGLSSLCIALFKGHFEVAKWLILNGALAPHVDVFSGSIDDMIMRRDLSYESNYVDDDKRLALLSWAQDAVTTHDNFQLFLTGTTLFPESLELISQYVAEPRTQHEVRTLRQLVDRLPTFIANRRLIRRDRSCTHPEVVRTWVSRRDTNGRIRWKLLVEE